MDLKKDMIVRVQDRNWIVLPVTSKDISWKRRLRAINAPKPGLYGFAGMWYGSNPFKPQSYGKIIELNDKDISIVRTHLSGLNRRHIQQLVG